MRFFRKIIVALIVLLNFILSSPLFGQEHPPIINFQPSDYNGENQNWGISQDDNGFIFIANNDGLLEFNGSKWNLYKSPNFSIMRSVMVSEGRIYAGYHREFGYWKRSDSGALKYTSISDSLSSEMFEDENIWNIKSIDQWIVFQSYNRIYFYHPDSEKITFNTEVGNYYRIFNVSNRLYLQKKDRSIYLLRNGKEELIVHLADEFNIKLVLNIFETTNKELLFLTRKKGIFILTNSGVKQWDFPAKDIISKYQIFGGIQLRDGSFVLGTISNGLIVLDRQGNLKYQIDKSDGLGNNTVLSLFEDADNNVWAGLDNGIDCLNTSSYITEYFDSSGSLGTIYASKVINGSLYLGTNQGLFRKELNTESNPVLVNGTRGQVWSLEIFDGDLICGHTDGTFLIDGDSSTLISPIQGAWGFKPIPDHPNKILTGNYQGLSVLEKINDRWQLRNKIEGFNNSSRFFEIMHTTEIWVNHEYKGIFKLEVDNDFRRVTSTTLSSKIPKAENSSILKYNSELLYYTKEGIFNVNTKDGTIMKDSILNKITSSREFLSGKMIEDSNNRLWTFSNKSIIFTELSPVYGDIISRSIPLNLESRKTTVSFENISEIGEDKYLIGGTNNYLVLDLKKLVDSDHQIFINSVQAGGAENTYSLVNKEKDLQLPYAKRSVKFSYSVPNYNKYEAILYQYRLKGLKDAWSTWQNSQTVSFEKLPYGDYNFEVRSKIGESISSNTERFIFTVKRPFYLSNFMLVCYLVIAILIAFLINKSYKRLYKNRHEKALQKKQNELELNNMQNQKEVFKLRNEKLNQDIESKNRELAISTMSIVKRNEVLRNIKKELKKNTSLSSNNSVFKLINQNLNSKEDWTLFENAFNQADNEFFARVKDKHPNLNNNDLKFCAYLRLNLSSKEIAPLLNISSKSVEVRRYRLRKKLELHHEVNLIDYVLNI